MENKYNKPLSWERDVVPRIQPSGEDSTFRTIVKQLGGGTWAESIAREILSEASAETEDN